MRRISIICKCGQLADVADKTIVAHKIGSEFCERSGERYVSSPARTAVNPDGRQMEFLGALEIPCPACHEHAIGGLAIFREKTPSTEPTPREWVN